MPWTYRIDEERRLIVTTVRDKLTGAEVGEHQRKLLNDPRFEADYFQLLDFADVVDFQIDRSTVAELARFDLFSARSRRRSSRQTHSLMACRACSWRSANFMAMSR